MTIHVFAAEIFVLSRAHVPLGTLQVPTDDFLNWTTYPVPLPLHDTSTPPDVMVLATADTADAVPDAEAVVDVDADDDDVAIADDDDCCAAGFSARVRQSVSPVCVPMAVA